MEQNVLDILMERGFVYQTTNDDALKVLLGKKPATCYIGFDTTADSLHVGSLIPIMGLVHMQRCGHRVIALIGGGTTMVGDPSGKTEMRKMLTHEQIERNMEGIKKQLDHYLTLDGSQGMMLNNLDWLLPLKYIEFLRDFGVHFSVNKMLSAESYKARLETGLSFIEFNYMLLQAYDFYYLADKYDCELQMGGQDQWGNIVAGSDLIRRIIGKQVYGLTFPLLMKAGGEKFGKSESGTVWLDAEKTPVYEFYQYWRNIDDGDVKNCLLKLTLLPMDEVLRLPEENINRAKEILAYEVTRMAHGKDEAAKAFNAAVGQFGSGDPEGKVRTSSEILQVSADNQETVPVFKINRARIGQELAVVTLFQESGLTKSKGEARRLIQGNGAYMNGERITDPERTISVSDLKEGVLLLQAGKKRHKRIVFE